MEDRILKVIKAVTKKFNVRKFINMNDFGYSQIERDLATAIVEEVNSDVDLTSAEYVKEVTVLDPVSKLIVEMSVFKHNQSGGMFAVDSSYLDQNFDDDTDPVIADPLNPNQRIKLFGL
jgi:hypothetical protein